MITLREVAEKVGVSPTTVANVIHGRTNKVSAATCARVNEELKRSNYVSNMGARLLGKCGSKIIAVVIAYDDGTIHNPFCGSVMESIEQEVAKYGYYVMLCTTTDSQKCIKMALAWNVEGIILLGAERDMYYTLKARLDVPIVTIDTCFKKTDERYVNIGLRDIEGGYEMTKYLLSKGHKRIGFVELSQSDKEKDIVYINEARKRGYLGALEEAKVIPNANCVSAQKRIFKLSLDDRERKKQILEIAKNDFGNCSALFFTSDMLAIESMNIFLDAGYKIPQDVSIAGFDDVNMASMIRPRLTTVHQEITLKGIKSVEEIMKILDGKLSVDKDIRLPIKIIERDTVSQNTEIQIKVNMKKSPGSKGSLSKGF